MSTQQTKNWEEEFDEKFDNIYKLNETRTVSAQLPIGNEIKQFIKDIRKQDEEELIKNIGFLRQWLNEDRITDVSRMVTNEQLLRWFNK